MIAARSIHIVKKIILRPTGYLRHYNTGISIIYYYTIHALEICIRIVIFLIFGIQYYYIIYVQSGVLKRTRFIGEV